MIFYLATRRHRYTIEDYRRTRGRAIASRITPLAYEQVLRARRARAGTWIFTDLERLSHGAAEDAARLWRDLEESGAPVRLLNHPTRSMRRYELLRHLHERGSNDFDVYRLTEARAPRRYPVFVRGENDHAGSRTPLLHDPEELASAVEDLQRRGYSRQRLLVTEFCGTAGTDGVVRKYAAFCVGGRILPRHVFAAKRWVVKGPEVVDDEAAEVERVYVETNPHASALREIFSLARIDYGRIDYGMRGGRIQVWEINTNPYVTTDGDVGGPLRDWVGPHFAESLRAAWEAIDLEPQARAPIRLHPASRPGRVRALAARGRAWMRNES